MMFRVESQVSQNFDDFSALQYGWDFTVAQIGPRNLASKVSLTTTPNFGLNRFWYGTAFDQTLRSRSGFVCFGLVDADNPATFVHDQLIPNDSITVFPGEEDVKAFSPEGFRGSGMHFSEKYLATLADKTYNRPLDQLLPAAGMYLPDPEKLAQVRGELFKWQQLETHNARHRSAIIDRREESLAMSVIDAIGEKQPIKNDRLILSEKAVVRALEYIHESDLENISATGLSMQAGCSQRLLEMAFRKRLGVTPKKYIKYLRLAQVHEELKKFDVQGYASIIELAGIYGFWHMGQFAADYRRIYGALPSEMIQQQ